MRLLLVLALAMPALAHGGGRFRGPGNGGVPPGLREPSDPEPPPPPPSDEVTVSESVTFSERWGDVARCRVQLSFLPTCDGTEGRAQVAPGPLFAAVAASVRSGDEALHAVLRPARYVDTPRLAALVALRGDAGRVDVRVFPLRAGVPETVVIEGYVLVDSTRLAPLRIYRTGDRCLAVARDWQGFRSLRFLSEDERRVRHAEAPVEDVPFVAALESAMTGRGAHAASDDTALAVRAPSHAPEAPPSPRARALPEIERRTPGRPAPARESPDPEPPPSDPARRDE